MIERLRGAYAAMALVMLCTLILTALFTERRRNEAEIMRAEKHQRMLVAELDHRVKNVLACVAAVAQRSRECSRSADEFLEVLNGRINSLANTHVLLSRSRWEGVGLGDLVRSELAPCMSNGNSLKKNPPAGRR